MFEEDAEKPVLTYVIGPFTLSEFLFKRAEAEAVFNAYSSMHPTKEVRITTTIPKERDNCFIHVEVIQHESGYN
jgi:hypothetical protein